MKSLPYTLVLSSALSLMSPAVVQAHGEGYWTEYMIDNKNDTVELTIEQTRKTLADIALRRRPVTSWPDPQVRNLRLELLVMEEEVGALLEHLKVTDGINLQLPSKLREIPQAGRSVAGSYAVETALEIVDHVLAMSGPEKLEEELHEDGVIAYQLALMDAYSDTMAVYKNLQQAEMRRIALENTLSFLNQRTAGYDLRFHLRALLRKLGFEEQAERWFPPEIPAPPPSAIPAQAAPTP